MNFTMHKIYKKFPDLVTMIICINRGKELLRTYPSPSMALLAFDLANGVKINDFLILQSRESPPSTVTIIIAFQMVLDLEVLRLKERIYLLHIAQYRNLCRRMLG